MPNSPALFAFTKIILIPIIMISLCIGNSFASSNSVSKTSPPTQLGFYLVLKKEVPDFNHQDLIDISNGHFDTHATNKAAGPTLGSLPVFSADDIRYIESVQDPLNNDRMQTKICMTDTGSVKLADFSINFRGDQLALVFENKVLAQPFMHASILGGVLILSPGVSSDIVQKMKDRIQIHRRLDAQSGIPNAGLVSSGCSDLGVATRTITYLNKSIHRDQSNSELYYLRGAYFATEGDLEKAILDFTYSIAIDPKNIDSIEGRAGVYVQLKKYSHALDDFNRAVILDPQSSGLFYARGDLYQRQGKHEFAIFEFSKSIQQFDNYWLVYAARGDSYFDNGQLELALNDYSRAIELQDSSDNYNNRAWLLYKTGRLTAGIIDADKAIDLNPLNGYAFGTRGHLYEETGKYKLAIKDFEKALMLEPDSQFIESWKKSVKKLNDKLN